MISGVVNVATPGEELQQLALVWLCRTCGYRAQFRKQSHWPCAPRLSVDLDLRDLLSKSIVPSPWRPPQTSQSRTWLTLAQSAIRPRRSQLRPRHDAFFAGSRFRTIASLLTILLVTPSSSPPLRLLVPGHHVFCNHIFCDSINCSTGVALILYSNCATAHIRM